MDENFLWDEKPGLGVPRLFNLLSLHAKKENKSVHGVLNVRAFASSMGLSHEGVYKWVRNDYFLAKNISKIREVSQRSLTVEMLVPYTTKKKKTAASRKG